MKKAISGWCFPGKSVNESMAEAKAAGFDGIELTLEESGETGLDSTPAKWAEIRAYADEIGLSIHSVATGLLWSYPLTSDDEEVREKGIKVVEKQLDMAETFGADAILIIPGAVDARFIPNFKPVPYDTAYERAFAAVMRLKEKAEAKKVHIGVENVWNMFLMSPLEMREFIDKIGSPYVGVYFDVGNVVATGFPEDWIRILGKRIRKVHFKDYRISVGGLDGFVDLLSGDVNWPAVMDAFREVGYDGWVTAEMIPPYTHHPEQNVINACGAMRKILGEA